MAICQYCSEPAKLKCPICKVPYCSPEHQKILYKYHKLVCAPVYPRFVLPHVQRWELELWARKKFLPKNQALKNPDTGLKDNDDAMVVLGMEVMTKELGIQNTDPQRSVYEIMRPKYETEEAYLDALQKYSQDQFDRAPKVFGPLQPVYVRILLAQVPRAEIHDSAFLPMYSISMLAWLVQITDFPRETINLLLHECYLYNSYLHLMIARKVGQEEGNDRMYDVQKRLIIIRKTLFDSNVKAQGGIFQEIDTFVHSPEYRTKNEITFKRSIAARNLRVAKFQSKT